MDSSSPPFMLYALPISSSSTWPFWLCLARSTSYEAPYYSVFSNLLSLHLSLMTTILLSTLFSKTLSLCYSLNVRDQVSHPYRTTGIIIGFNSRQQMRRQNVLDWMAANITQIQTPLNFILHQALICYCRIQIFELYHSFKASVSYLYIMISPCIHHKTATCTYCI
jgi:hypothetical protein